jgi:uncharacterized protein
MLKAKPRPLMFACLACSALLACGSDAATAMGGTGGGAVAGAPSGGSAAGGGSNLAGASSQGGGQAGSLSSAGGGGAPGAGAGGMAAGAGAGGTAAGAGGSGGGVSGSSKILIYGVTTGFRHGSISAAADALATAAMTHGLSADRVGCTDATNKPDATKLSTTALMGYGAVILLANSGEPFGYPATAEIQNLVDYVKGGGALVAIEDADHCYDGAFDGHPASTEYVSLIGNDFVGHPGGVALATCTKVGTGPAIDKLPATFTTTDEIYETKSTNPANLAVLTCVSSGDASKAVRPISYVREEGAGRVFFTALGHPDASWTSPMDAAAANSRLVEDHVMPALLWAMRR